MKRFFNNCNPIYRYTVYGVVAILITLLTGIYVFFLTGFSNGTIDGSLSYYVQKACSTKIVYAVALFLFIGFVIFDYYGKKILQILYLYRYLIAFLFFVICIVFELNGSSIGMWSNYLGGTDTGNLIGVSRGIRSDEWAVSTPMMLSQYFSEGGKFPYYNEIVRGTATDMFVVYGQPVLDIAIIFKPFYWGYLFLSAGKGLAFFWYGRWIALFLVSFEMFMLITKEDKWLSFAGASLFAFAPAIQWWFAICGLVEMLIYGQLSVILLQKYMKSVKTGERALYLTGIFLCAGGFILILYPAWQVPMAYVILGLGIWVILENYKDFKISKKDLICLLVLSGVFIAIMLHIWSNSKETIELVLNTDYPGQRSETGGGVGLQFFNYISNIWYALLGEGTGANVCESAQFIDFFPICYIFPLYVLVKKRDRFTGILFCVDIILIIWCVVGFPGFLAKITLMSFSTAPRAFIILGVVNIFLLIRSLSLTEIKCPVIFGGILAVVGGFVVVKIGTLINREYYPNIGYFILSVIILSMFFYLLIRFTAGMNKVFFSILCVGLMLYTGALVNPIRHGVSSVYETEVLQAVQSVHNQDKQALWIVEGLQFPYNNVCIMAGAPTVNSTNVYPYLERWEEFDQDGENREVYNRYAHIIVELKENKNAEFILNQADVFTVKLNAEDLKTLNVTYILSSKDNLEQLSVENVKFERVREAGNYYIYHVQ